jgi:hypothetical protein
MNTALALVLLLPLAGQPEKKESIEDLAARLATERKAAAATEAELRARLAELNTLLRDLGINPDAPPGPRPVDALAKKLRDAFAADKGKKDDALSLAALYRQAATLARDPGVPSSGELLRRVREASATLVGPDALPGLRTVVAGELAAALGRPSDLALTDAQRQACADLFAKLAAILETI